MKICPRCQTTYADDNLNFCLEDGSVLNQMASEPPQTVQMGQPITQQQPSYGTSGSQPAWTVPPQQYVQPAKKSSKTWIWVLLILGAAALICGSGLIGFLAYVGSQADKNEANVAKTNGRTPSPSPGKTTSSKTNPDSTRTDVTNLDLQMFVKEFSPYGTTVLNDGELTMGSKQKGFYYVLVAPEDYKTENADTSVTLRNVDNASGSLGYGLIFHSNPQPLLQDYAFLIDTKKKKYRVVHHEPSKESVVVPWTNSNAIVEGADENTLEVRDDSDKIDLYINGTLVNSIHNVYGYPDGVVGLYAGDGVKVAFKDLQIRR